jgi:hypothetical protein
MYSFNGQFFDTEEELIEAIRQSRGDFPERK